MAHKASVSNPARRATNVTIREDLLVEAKELAVNLSRAAEQGIGQAVAEKRAARWQAENAEAIASSNDYVERNGLPLARHRQF